MSSFPPVLTAPRILVLDDERQIHASLRLRLSDLCEPVLHVSGLAALKDIRQEAFDLCIVDVHMPDMDGFEFIEQAQRADPGLGFVILTGYFSGDNLLQAIPFRTYDLLCKPIPDREAFEDRVPGWIERTRLHRREIAALKVLEKIGPDLDLALIEREVEIVASEAARDALLQTANALTTIQALLLNATYALEKSGKLDNSLTQTIRSLQEARRTAESAATIAEGYFSSSYANRETASAYIATGLKQALAISTRHTKAEEQRKTVDCIFPDAHLVAQDITGIDLLLMLVPAVNAALELSAPNTTVQIRTVNLPKLEALFKEVRLRPYLWVNRKNASTSRTGVAISIRASAPAWDHPAALAWLQDGSQLPVRTPGRGLRHGLQKGKGLLAVSVKPGSTLFEMVLALPT